MENAGSKGNLAEIARKAQRDERLAAQLRANLKRRKAAARARGEPPETGDVAGDDSSADPGEDAVQPTANKATA
jgi:hypothetical protein